MCKKKSLISGGLVQFNERRFGPKKMHITDHQIENMPEQDQKRDIRKKPREAAFVYLQSLEEGRKKSE